MNARTRFPIMAPSTQQELEAAMSAQVVVYSVPWPLMAAHEAQAQQNHRQSLETLASRGGLSACEAIAVLEDRPYRWMPLEDAYRQLGELVRTTAHMEGQ